MVSSSPPLARYAERIKGMGNCLVVIANSLRLNLEVGIIHKSGGGGGKQQ